MKWRNGIELNVNVRVDRYRGPELCRIVLKCSASGAASLEQ